MTLASPDDILDLANSFMAPRILLGAARTGVFEALAAGPRTAAEVAAARGLDARACSLVLLALEGMGLVERAGLAFALAPLARECLIPGSPRDLLAYLALDADTFESWSRLEESLRSGRPIEVSSRGAREGSPERHRAFIRGMRSTALGNAPTCARGLDWEALLGRPPRTLADVGGGPGTYALEFCRREAGLRATVIDLEETVAIARECVAEEPDRALASRISFLAADFHEDPLGGPYDVAWVSHIVHGHPEATLVPLLEKIRASLAPGGIVAVHDFVLDDGRARPPYATIFGVNMLVMSDRGRTYSRGEIADLLARAGFGEARHHDLGERRGISVVTARVPSS